MNSLTPYDLKIMLQQPKNFAWRQWQDDDMQRDTSCIHPQTHDISVMSWFMLRPEKPSTGIRWVNKEGKLLALVW